MTSTSCARKRSTRRSRGATTRSSRAKPWSACRSRNCSRSSTQTQFAQVHRSVVVNLRAISHVTRGANETADIHLKGREEVLPVSRSYLHLVPADVGD